ncbi:transposase [Desulfobulbus sp.]|uniref:transposase n=1 Tax=Desulfobulbus sp. TaxID=895 RepID=UPI0027B99D4E|nr:transposase [Desulfobulbus sp.]
MVYNPDMHHRRSIRVKGYDYSSAGAYFVTLCTHNRQCLFGEIVGGEMCLNAMGKIVAEEWVKTGLIRQENELDAWVVMPNHLHGIVMVLDQGARRAPLQPNATNRRGERAPKSLGALIAGFKSAATKRINQMRQTPGPPIWQRNYWEHIVRNEKDLHEIRQYICNNPMSWAMDTLFVAR